MSHHRSFSASLPTSSYRTLSIGVCLAVAGVGSLLGEPAGLVARAAETVAAAPAARPTPESAQWRRTTRGWERIDRADGDGHTNSDLPAITGVHPLVVASLQVLIAILLWQAAPGQSKSRPARSASASQGGTGMRLTTRPALD